MLEDLEAARRLYERRAWHDAHRAFARADEQAPLQGDDLERLAYAAWLIGRDQDCFAALDRAHHAHRQARAGARAARCAFWLGLRFLLRGEAGPANGWLARARRLVESEGRACVEEGYLRMADAERALASGDRDAAGVSADLAARIGDRFGDADLAACARHVQGRVLVEAGDVEAGLALLDEAMVAVTGGELSSVVTGLVYCSVIDACLRVHDWRRARDWTSALARWCSAQEQLVAFTTTCLVHRSEVLAFAGAWDEALDEARAACARAGAEPPAAALYQQGEVHRLRGEIAAAEDAYREASRRGRDPQPGLALLRMAQGRTDAALVGLRRAVDAAADRFERARLLPAWVEVLAAAGALDEARTAVVELEQIASLVRIGALPALAAHARGHVELSAGEARAAASSLARARDAWQRVEAPHFVARARELTARACRELGDEDGVRLELEAARAAYAQLRAGPDLARVDATRRAAPTRTAHGLTRRELQVLALVAAGESNKSIARELGLSGKTVDRHVSNIFAKLDVPSRAAATAYAYRHALVLRAPVRRG